MRQLAERGREASRWLGSRGASALFLFVLAGCATGTSNPIDRDSGPIDPPDLGELDTAPPPPPGTCARDPECDDGLFCTNDRCESGTCANRPEDLRCDPGFVCDATTGCVPGPACTTDAECDDGLYCTGVERCDPTLGCVDGVDPECADTLDCTIDACNEDLDTCAFAPDHARCSDGDFCNGEETCDSVIGCVPAAAAVNCDDSIDCTNDACDAVAGRCVNEPIDERCDDGLVCNGPERCVVMAGCRDGEPLDCGDGIPCTTDTCAEPGTCSHGSSDADMDGFVAVGCGMGDDCDDTRAAVNPRATEVCNGVDDDCSGGADDAAGMDCVLGAPPRGCTTSCGTAGTQTCSTSCRLGPCVASTETCNDCDDNGNGSVDEGLACRRATTVACTTACGSLGARTCAADCSGFGSCVGTEVCNGCDDDGDGVRDDGVGVCPSGAAEPCTTPSGVPGMRTCAADCSGFGACVAGEICNGLDDDGDGDPDDGFPCVRGMVQPCTTACGMPGSRTCGAMCTFPACTSGEVCGNACDDDGDGLVDELCNDLCANAVALSPVAGGTTTGTTDGAAREVMDCQTTTGTPGGEVWYSITVATRSLVYFDTFGTSYDTTLSLRPACGGAQSACEDDDCGTLQEQLVAIVAPGTYYLAVQARRLPGTGPFNLRWQSFAVPANGTPTRITGNGTFTGTTMGTASSWPSCDGAGIEGFHYLTVCPATTRTLTASTCASTFDTVVSIANASVIACDDDTCGVRSTAVGMVSGPGAYQVIVDSFSCCASNAYSLAISGL